jgi:hypothetical protein
MDTRECERCKQRPAVWVLNRGPNFQVDWFYCHACFLEKLTEEEFKHIRRLREALRRKKT